MNERQRIYKRAAKRRNASAPLRKKGKKPRRGAHWDGEDASQRPQPLRQRNGSLKDWALRVLAEDEIVLQAELAVDQDLHEATVVAASSGACEVVLGDQRLRCSLVAQLRRRQQEALAVGDRVLVRDVGDASVVERVLPRTSQLSRLDPQNPRRERVLLANVDTVVIVVTLAHPPLITGLIDRFLIAIERGRARALICANKIDLCTPAERQVEAAKLDLYRERSVASVLCSATTHEGLSDLRRALEGKLCAFVGKSGVGKSSLLNALLAVDAERVAAVRETDGKGRHTTTRATLHDLEAGTRIIDTPGIRSLGLAAIDAKDVARYFPQIGLWAVGCRFRDCTHTREPDCAVVSAVREGRLAQEHWLGYLRIIGAELCGEGEASCGTEEPEPRKGCD